MKQFQKELLNSIKKSKNIYVMGHKSIDLDALGACVGLADISKKYKKNCSIIINDTEIEKASSYAIKYLDNIVKIVSSNKVKNIEEKDLLIIVDVNKKFLFQDSEIVNKFKRKILIDHHNKGKGSIDLENEFINTDYSSTCEIITELIINKNIKISQKTATLLLCGIVLDTNSYALNTSERTFLCSAFLISKKANARKVQTFFKQDIEDYKERQKLLLNLEIVNKNTAITLAGEKKFYRREYLAKAADTLLLFNGIETSYVIARLNENEIGISARSTYSGKVNKVLEKMNGGGSPKEAAAVIKETSLEKVKKELISQIK